jgi:hypothetical protein
MNPSSSTPSGLSHLTSFSQNSVNISQLLEDKHIQLICWEAKNISISDQCALLDLSPYKIKKLKKEVCEALRVANWHQAIATYFLMHTKSLSHYVNDHVKRTALYLAYDVSSILTDMSFPHSDQRMLIAEVLGSFEENGRVRTKELMAHYVSNKESITKVLFNLISEFLKVAYNNMVGNASLKKPKARYHILEKKFDAKNSFTLLKHLFLSGFMIEPRFAEKKRHYVYTYTEKIMDCDIDPKNHNTTLTQVYMLLISFYGVLELDALCGVDKIEQHSI